VTKSKIIWTVVFVLVAIAVLIWGLRRAGILGGTEPPAWVGGQLIERIDSKTGELMTKPLEEWDKLGQKGGVYKHPETGEYTMEIPIVCESCGAKIAPPSSPPDPEGTGLGLIRAVAKMKCPKCGGPVVRLSK